MQDPSSKPLPTSRLYFLMQKTPTLEDNNGSAMDVDDLVKETLAPAASPSSSRGVRFQPGTSFHVQTRPRPPLTPRRPRTRISELSTLDRPRKLDLTRLLHEDRDDGEMDAQFKAERILESCESETTYTHPKEGQHSTDSSCELRNHRSHPWESGEEGYMDLDTNSPRPQDSFKKPTPGISPGIQHRGQLSLGYEKVHLLTKASESKKRTWSSVKSTAGVGVDGTQTDEDDFWDPRVDRSDQDPIQLSLKQPTDVTKLVHAPSRLQHLLRTIPGESGSSLSTSEKSYIPKCESQEYDNMSAPSPRPISTTLWHGRRPSEAGSPPSLSPRRIMGSRSASHTRGSPYPTSGGLTRHIRSKATEITRGAFSAVVPRQVPSSSRLSPSLGSLPPPRVRTPTSGSSRYETVPIQTPGCSTPRRYAVEKENNRTDQDWPSSPLADHSLRPSRTEDNIESKLYTGSLHTQISHIPASAPHHSSCSTLLPADDEEDQTEIDRLSQESYSDSTSDAIFSSLRGYMTPKRSSSSSSPPGPPIRKRNVRTRIASLQDTPPSIGFGWSPSDYVQSPCTQRLRKQSASLPMLQHGLLLRESEPLNLGIVSSRRMSPRAFNSMFNNELDNGTNATPDLDSGTSVAFVTASVTTNRTVHPLSKTADTNTSSFGVRTEQEHEDPRTTGKMNAKRALDNKGGRESMSIKEK